MNTQPQVQSIRLPLVTLTPLFLGGADPRGQPELRASSFRGALRFWLRALLGGCYGADERALEVIREQEAHTFGTSGGRDSAGASKVLVRLLPASHAASSGSLRIEAWNAPRDRPRSYLFFSMASSKVRGQEIPARSFIAIGYPFVLELVPRAGVPKEEAYEALGNAVRAAWLLLHLGGIGARARRLGGALAHRPVQRRTPEGQVVTSVPRHLNLPFELDPSPKQAAQELGEALSSLRKSLRCRPNVNPERPAWEVLDPRWCRIWVFGERDWTSGERGWPAVADAIGSWLRDTRRQLP
ncbi:MAG: type III-B CRISPR module RAMP protein Cmr1, partial [Thermomicrobium sp.]